MPESLIFLTENSPGVSNDRFGLKAVRCEKSRLRFAVGTFLQGEQVWDFEKFFSLAELPLQAEAKVLLSSLFP